MSASLVALGIMLRDEEGRQLRADAASLHRATTIDRSGVPAGLRGARIVVATDVSNLLTGPDGAAAVFGPQKGADPDDVVWLAAGLERWAAVLANHGRAVDGLAGVPAALAGCDLVLTGEGSFDRQSLAGKAPIAVARAAVGKNARVGLIAGRIGVAAVDLASAGVTEARALVDLARGGEDPMRDAAALAERAAADICRALLG